MTHSTLLKTKFIGTIFISLCIVLFSSNISLAAIHGENDIWPAPDDLRCLPWAYDVKTEKCSHSVDSQLSNLIKRTGMTYAGGSQGTAFLIGSQCDWIISTKHTINHLNGKQRAPNQTHFFRNAFENNVLIQSKNQNGILILNKDTTQITDLTDRKLTKLTKPAFDQRLTRCPEVPLQTAKELKRNLDQIHSCIIISFNQDLGNHNAAKRGTMTLRTKEGLKKFNARTRGITTCNIVGFASDGMIETNCDSVYAASGSPFFCQAKDQEWKLTGTLFADTCYGHNKDENCLDPTKSAKKTSKTLMLPFNKPLSKH